MHFSYLVLPLIRKEHFPKLKRANVLISFFFFFFHLSKYFFRPKELIQKLVDQKLNSALYESIMTKWMTKNALKQIKLDQLNLFDIQKPTRLMKKRSNKREANVLLENAQGNPEENVNANVQDLVLNNLFKLWNRQEVVVPSKPKMY